MSGNGWTRRNFVKASASIGIAPTFALPDDQNMEATITIQRPIPGTKEMLPVIGLGTYSVFDVDSTAENLAARKQIVDLLIERGGKLIDSSPMYNRSEKLVGDIINAGTPRDRLFIATKVWTSGRSEGIQQMTQSANSMNSPVIDLMQVHNQLDLNTQMASIREAQAEGRIRYNGITDYRSSALTALEAAIKQHRPDFIQINYSLGETDADKRVLPLAAELGIAVLINRPFMAGRLFRAVGSSPLPSWAMEFAASWGQFFLKFIVSHPAVHCVIPATSKLRHLEDNLGAGSGDLPDSTTRKRMIDYIASL